MNERETSIYLQWTHKANQYINTLREKYPELSLEDMTHLALVHLVTLGAIEPRMQRLVRELTEFFIQVELESQNEPQPIERKLKLL